MCAPLTNDRSIFRMSIGRCFKRERDEYPVPKSSIAIWNPASWRNCRMSRVCSGSVMAVDSVISIVTLAGATPADSNVSSSFVAKRADHNWRGDTLKPTLSSRPSSAHARD